MFAQVISYIILVLFVIILGICIVAPYLVNYVIGSIIPEDDS